MCHYPWLKATVLSFWLHDVVPSVIVLSGFMMLFRFHMSIISGKVALNKALLCVRLVHFSTCAWTDRSPTLLLRPLEMVL